MSYLSNIAGSGSAHDLGYFATPTDLTTSHPTAMAGDYAIVGSTDTVWVWDTGTSAWVDTGTMALDVKVKASAADTTNDYLISKISNTDGNINISLDTGIGGVQTVKLNMDRYVSIGYNNFVNLISNGNLVPGLFYLINDYQTIHIIPGTTDINYGQNEGLLVLATAGDCISNQVWSIDYQEDYLEYDWTNTYVDGITTRPGWITKRRETRRNIQTPCDFRNVLQFRYSVDTTGMGYDSSLTYSIGDWVVGSDDHFYVSLANSNSNNDPLISPNHWLKFQDKNELYQFQTSWNPACFNTPFLADISSKTLMYMFSDITNGSFTFGNINNKNIIIEAVNSQTDEIPNVVFNCSVLMHDIYIKSIMSATFTHSCSDISINSGSLYLMFQGSCANLDMSQFMFNSFFSTVTSSRFECLLNGNVLVNCYDLNIKQEFTKNILGTVTQTSFGSSVYENVIQKMSDCNIGSNIEKNIFVSIIGKTAKFLTVLPGSSEQLNYNTATYIYDDYNTEIYMRPDQTSCIRFVDDTDNWVVDLANN